MVEGSVAGVVVEGSAVGASVEISVVENKPVPVILSFASDRS